MPVRFEVDADVGVLTLDRPERAHAYDAAHLGLFELALEGLQGVRALVVQSTGDGAFCAGADTRALGAASWQEGLDLASQRLFTRLARASAVSIAAIQGPAVAGGLELALACDLRVAGPKARFWLPETALGILPSAGGTTRLARLIGPARAKEVILGGREVDAETALAWGLVHRVEDDPRAFARSWAHAVARRDPEAQARAKRLLDANESDTSLLAERVVEAGLYVRRRG